MGRGSYVGEGDNVLKRLVDHDVKRDDWNRAVLVISKDNNITKAHGRYLESRLIQVVSLAGRVKLLNVSNPPIPTLPESDMSDMEYFLEQTQLILPVLGCNFLKPKPKVVYESEEGAENGSPLFILKQVGLTAKAMEVENEFVVLKGSMARKNGVPSWDAYVKLRDQLVTDGKLIQSEDTDKYIFTEDTSFSSPSAASACVMASNRNGRTDWKTEETGLTYEQWSRQKLESL